VSQRFGLRELMRMHMDVLYVHDARGRMVRVNEPGGGRAPRFHIGRTIEGCEWRVRDDVDDVVRAALGAEVEREARGDEYPNVPYGAPGYERILEQRGPVQKIWAGPAFSFPEDLPSAPGVKLVTEENADVLRPHLEPWLPDVGQGMLLAAALIEGHAVGVCGSARVSDAAHEAGVETARDFRREGHGFRAVMAWAAAVRALGCEPLYSTSWENRASQALAAKLGLVRFGTDLHLT
jgi:GNAT superfamily N-acetyltransferase